MNIFLRGSYSIKLHTHILNLLGLCMVDVGLTRNVFVALLDFTLCILVLFSNVTLSFFRLRQLNFDVAKRVLEFLVLNLAKSEHLTVFYFRTFLTLHTEASSHNSLLL